MFLIYTIEGHKFLIEQDPAGVKIGIIPKEPPLGGRFIDIFTVGLRFSTVVRLLSAIDQPAGFLDDVVLAKIRREKGKVTFHIPYNHLPDEYFSATLNADDSEKLIYFLNSLIGNSDAQERIQNKSYLDLSRNSKCPCGSDKKYKKCCGVAVKNIRNNFNELLEYKNYIDPEVKRLVAGAKINPEVLQDSEFWHHLGNRLGFLKDYKLAIKTQRKALELCPQDEAIIADLAATIAASGNNQEAWNLLEGLKNSDGRYSAIKGNVLSGLDRKSKALQEYEKAIAFDPKFFLPYHRIVELMDEMMHPLHEYWLRRSLRELPNSPFIGLAYANWLIQENRLEELVDADWTEKLQHTPDPRIIGGYQDGPKAIIQVQTLQLIAKSIVTQNHDLLKKAADILDSAPTDWHLCTEAEQLARAASIAGRRDVVWSASRRFCKNCAESRLGITHVHSLLGQAAINAGNPDQAIEDAENALKSSQEDPRIDCFYWWALDEVGRSDEALRVAQRFYEKAPEHENIAYNIGYLSGKLGSLAIAQRYYEIELKKSPSNPWIYENLSYIKIISNDILAANELMMLWEKKTAEFQDPERFKALKEKYEKLSQFAEFNAEKVTYSKDITNFNKSTDPFFGAETRIPARKLTREEIILALTAGSTNVKDETLFALQMEHRGDYSSIAIIVENEIPKAHKLPKEAFITLIEAQIQIDDQSRVDFSPCCMAFCKALEITLYHLCFVKFRSEIMSRSNYNSLLQDYQKSLIDKGAAFYKFVVRKMPLELGSMSFILPLCKGKTADSMLLLGHFRDWLLKVNYEALFNTERPEQIQSIAKKYRNPAAHTSVFNRNTAIDVKNACYEQLAFLTSMLNDD